MLGRTHPASNNGDHDTMLNRLAYRLAYRLLRLVARVVERLEPPVPPCECGYPNCDYNLPPCPLCGSRY